MFQESFNEVLRLRGGPRVLEELSKGASRYLKEVQRVFQGSFKDVLRKIQEC